jgi:RNA polymerase sigma-70 factor (ECF subfamily)
MPRLSGFQEDIRHMDRSSSEIARSIQLAREGRGDLLGELLGEHRNYLRLLAATCLKREVRGKSDASDVVQDTLLKAHQRFHQFRGATQSEWMAWLRQILVNNIADLHRHYAVVGPDETPEVSLEAAMDRSSRILRDMVPAPGPTPSQAAEQREFAVVLADALAELDPEDSELVILRNLKELSWNEIAERTQLSPGAARMRWTRALQRLGPRLKERMS